MFKHVAIVLFAVMVLVSTGCNPGSNRYSKACLYASLVEIAQSSSSPTKELK